MNKICLCCGKELDSSSSYWHKACINKMFNSYVIPNIDLSEDKIIEDNLNKGDVLTGVQKKFSITLSSTRYRKTFSTINNEYIIKTQQEGLNNIVYYEWIGMKLAEINKLDVVNCGIIKNKNELLYITKRIDRINNKKIPMEDFCQLSNSQTEYKYNGSYERCYKDVIQKYSSSDNLDKIKFYKVILFSYIIGNTDMHKKNFSLYNIGNGYQLTPFYDLVPVLMVFNQHEMALTLNGKKKNLTKHDFRIFAKSLDLNERITNNINMEIINSQEKMYAFINKTDLTNIEKERFISLIKERITLLY